MIIKADVTKLGSYNQHRTSGISNTRGNNLGKRKKNKERNNKDKSSKLKKEKK